MERMHANTPMSNGARSGRCRCNAYPGPHVHSEMERGLTVIDVTGDKRAVELMVWDSGLPELCFKGHDTELWIRLTRDQAHNALDVLASYVRIQCDAERAKDEVQLGGCFPPTGDQPESGLDLRNA